MILIDTNALIWATSQPQHLGPEARVRLDQATSDRQAAVAVISFWEVGMLVDKKRIALSDPEAWMRTVIGSGTVKVVELTPDIALAAGSLPGGIHGDPADRIIVATARALGCPVLTSDRQILAYAEAGHVAAINARL